MRFDTFKLYLIRFTLKTKICNTLLHEKVFDSAANYTDLLLGE